MSVAPNNNIVRVEGTDYMADIRIICKAVASVPCYVLKSVETLGVVGNPGDKYLVLNANKDILILIIKLTIKDNIELKDLGRRVVNLCKD